MKIFWILCGLFFVAVVGVNGVRLYMDYGTSAEDARTIAIEKSRKVLALYKKQPKIITAAIESATRQCLEAKGGGGIPKFYIDVASQTRRLNMDAKLEFGEDTYEYTKKINRRTREFMKRNQPVIDKKMSELKSADITRLKKVKDAVASEPNYLDNCVNRLVLDLK